MGGDALEPGTASPHDEESKRPFKAIACWRWDALALCLAFCEALRTLPGRRFVRAKPSPHSPFPPSSPCDAPRNATSIPLESAIGTLSVLDLLDETEEPGESICRITGSLLSLFEAEYARRHR
ncbi:TPA: hypothetical protein L4R01_001344 [Pseudomonas aeruginosa]|nr:hypothetical protein [Pseudomonas aeruginosa]NQB65504.1 hypothetical protein [Pseudomonas aeruginosa]NQC01162.1 hypothetical protein [Pseudomonas aeruginosa]HBO3110770.1 hypothetical protein [Pseudomonas aeruginosa]HBO3912194.1 hypothetical protein [Pseudomonas aeruginosa]